MKVFKLKAGALQFTMFMVVVIALLLAAFIILIHTYKTFRVQTDFVIETVSNTNKGIHYVLNNKLPLRDSISLNLNDEDYKTINVYRNFWGVFEKVTSISNIKHKTFKKVALVGGSQIDNERTALYLEDKNRPLVLVGNTKIKGIAYLPKQGVRTGNISGHSYYGSQLIYGKTKASSALPKLQLEVLKYLNEITDRIKNVSQEQFIDLSKSRIHENSFCNPVQVIYSPTDIYLSEVSLIGHIIVQSETKIIVDASSNLKDIVLIAPKIEVKNNTEGAFQALVTKEITIGTHCKLDYPSAFILNEGYKSGNMTSKVKQTPFIKINKSSIIKGIVAYLGTTKNYKSQIFIDKNVTVNGEVYCSQNLELLGTVNGSVFTSGFVANQSGSVYQNHIYNGSIIVDKLPVEYIGLPFKGSKKNVVKWLY